MALFLPKCEVSGKRRKGQPKMVNSLSKWPPTFKTSGDYIFKNLANHLSRVITSVTHLEGHCMGQKKTINESGTS